MSNKTVSSLEFWIGTVLSVAAVLVSIWSAKASIVAEQEATRREKAAEQLGDLSAAISGVGAQLESHASMFVEMEVCLKRAKKPKTCWQREYSFDPQSAAEAWATLGAREASLKPYLYPGNEVDTLEDLEIIRDDHSRDLRAMLPPENAEIAGKISERILATRRQVKEKYVALEKSISERVREKGTSNKDVAADG